MIIKHSDGTIRSVELDMNSDDSLAHHGVKGMHWGVRKEDKEIRAENRDASVTLPKMAYEKSVKRQERARQRYTQDPYSKRNRRKYEVQQSTTKELEFLKDVSEDVSTLALALGVPYSLIAKPRTTDRLSRMMEKNVRKRYENAWNNEYRHGTNWNRNYQF